MKRSRREVSLLIYFFVAVLSFKVTRLRPSPILPSYLKQGLVFTVYRAPSKGRSQIIHRQMGHRQMGAVKWGTVKYDSVKWDTVELDTVNLDTVKLARCQMGPL